MMPLTIQFGAVAFRLWPGGCQTVLPDGASLHAEPQDTAEYRERAWALGYGDDVLRMCREHEALHSALAYAMGRPCSPALWAAAHGQDDRHPLFWHEEAAVLRLARSLSDLRGLLDG